MKLHSSYSMFGKRDIAIWFESESNEAALHFVGDELHAVDDVLETHTKPMVLIRKFKKG